MPDAKLESVQNGGALVLGGGGMFAAFQAGVWQGIEGQFQPEVVIGASAGALNAVAIASGVTGDELTEMWLHLGAKLRLQLRVPSRWHQGIWNEASIRAVARELLARPRRRQLGVAVTHGLPLRNTLYRNDEVTEDTLLASCAVPLLLPAQRLAGGLGFDGGLREACPVWAAREFGVRATVAVDVWVHLPWQRRRVPARDAVYINPPAKLGSLSRSMFWNRDWIANCIELGRAEGSAKVHRIERQ